MSQLRRDCSPPFSPDRSHSRYCVQRAENGVHEDLQLRRFVTLEDGHRYGLTSQLTLEVPDDRLFGQQGVPETPPLADVARMEPPVLVERRRGVEVSIKK